MKKCLQNYPGLTEIITKYTGKQLVGIVAINVVHTIQISTLIGDLGVMLLEKNQKIHQEDIV